MLPPIILPLDCSNYILWKSQVIPTLACVLDDSLFGARTKPKQIFNDTTSSHHTSCSYLTTNQEFLHWNRLNQFLLSWLLSSIYENMLGHVIHSTTFSQVWKIHVQLFSTKSKACFLHIRFLLQTTKKGSMPIEDYVLKMKSFAHELMSARQLISYDELVLYIYVKEVL